MRPCRIVPSSLDIQVNFSYNDTFYTATSNQNQITLNDTRQTTQETILYVLFNQSTALASL
jgi:hypothetical protein